MNAVEETTFELLLLCTNVRKLYADLNLKLPALKATHVKYELMEDDAHPYYGYAELADKFLGLFDQFLSMHQQQKLLQILYLKC